METDESDYKFKKGANWIRENVMTLMHWVHNSAIYIDILGESIKFYKRILRGHTILTLSLSTLAGTASLSQFNLSEVDYPIATFFVKVSLTVMSFLVTLSNGYLKVYQIQEKLEKMIRLQQQWIQFGSTISAELQLPVHMRKDALFMIMKMNETYTQLFKQHIVANRAILKRVAQKNGIRAENLTLSGLFERTIQAEATRIEELTDEQTTPTGNPPTPENNPEPPIKEETRLTRFFPRTKSILASPSRRYISELLQKPVPTSIEDVSENQDEERKRRHARLMEAIRRRRAEEESSVASVASNETVKTARTTEFETGEHHTVLRIEV